MGERYIADVTQDGSHFRLICELDLGGYRVRVFDMVSGSDVTSHLVRSFDEGKKAAEQAVKGRLNEPIQINWRHESA